MAIDWQGVRREFEEGATLKKLSEKFKCTESAIRKRRRKEEWAKASGESGKRALKPEDVIGDHRSLWTGVKKRLVRGLHNSDVKQGLEELKVAKMAGEVLSNVIKGERLAWGLEDKGEILNDTEEIAGEMAQATVSSGAEEAVDGE